MEYQSGFNKARREARAFLQDDNKLMYLLDSAKEKADQSKDRLSEGLEDLYTLLRLLKSYTLGDYREISTKSILYVIAAIVYFVNPMDVIPDFIVSIGLLDDLTVLAFAGKNIKDEVDKFSEWEEEVRAESDSGVVDETAVDTTA